MTKIKLKNQEAKELFDDFERFEMFVHERWKWLVFGGISVVVAVAIYGAATYWFSHLDNKAVSALGVAKTEDELIKVIDEHSDHPAAARARQRLISFYVAEKKYDEALLVYGALLAGNISAEIRWRSELEMAYLNELKGNLEAAAGEFDRLGSSPVSEDIRSEASYSAGRLYLQLKNDAEADKCLKRVLSSPVSQSNSLWQMQARYLQGKVAPQARPAVSAPAVNAG
jgi:tetratricopeptide (TPR) repeat protein